MYNAMLREKEVQIGRTSFFVSPFPVFTAARITAQLSKTLAPALGGVIALFGDGTEGEETTADDAINADDIAASIPAFSAAMQGLNPSDFEKLFRELLVNSRNIAFKNADSPDGEILTEDSVNALFAGNTQDMYILAYHVIKENYSGFFEKLKNRSGIAKILEKLKGYSSDTEPSTQDGSETLSFDATP